MARKELKYTYVLTGRVPEEVGKITEEFIEDQQKDGFPRHNQGDLIRSAVVKFLKEKKYLKADKQYL